MKIPFGLFLALTLNLLASGTASAYCAWQCASDSDSRNGYSAFPSSGSGSTTFGCVNMETYQRTVSTVDEVFPNRRERDKACNKWCAQSCPDENGASSPSDDS